jgi:hypothetical protein
VQLRRHLWPAFSHRLVERSGLRPPRPVLCRCFPHRESSVAAGADTPAWADSVDISVTNKAELDKGYPQVHVNIQEPIAGFKWRVPNELSPGIAEAIGFPAVASQAFVVVVP